MSTAHTRRGLAIRQAHAAPSCVHRRAAPGASVRFALEDLGVFGAVTRDVYGGPLMDRAQAQALMDAINEDGGPLTRAWWCNTTAPSTFNVTVTDPDTGERQIETWPPVAIGEGGALLYAIGEEWPWAEVGA